MEPLEPWLNPPLLHIIMTPSRLTADTPLLVTSSMAAVDSW